MVAFRGSLVPPIKTVPAWDWSTARPLPCHVAHHRGVAQTLSKAARCHLQGGGGTLVPVPRGVMASQTVGSRPLL